MNSVGIIGALGVSALQTRRLVVEARQRDVDRQTERALELYRDLVVDGDTANAFHRLSVLLRHKGTAKNRVTTWYVMNDGDLNEGGLLDPSLTGLDTPFEDFYRVLWFFERTEMTLRFKLVNPHVLFNAAGFHCWWWGQLLRNIQAPKAALALRKLAPRAVGWAKENGVYKEWVSHCMTDFDGGAPVEFVGTFRDVPDILK